MEQGMEHGKLFYDELCEAAGRILGREPLDREEKGNLAIAAACLAYGKEEELKTLISLPAGEKLLFCKNLVGYIWHGWRAHFRGREDDAVYTVTKMLYAEKLRNPNPEDYVLVYREKDFPPFFQEAEGTAPADERCE